MLTLIKIESLRWWRNGNIFLLFLGLAALGYISILSSFYIEDIVKMSSTEGVSIVFPEPTQLLTIDSYFKNYSQIGIILCLFIFSKGIGASSDRATRVYYAVRSQWSYRIFLPKILNGLFWCLLSIALSYLLMRYLVWALFPDSIFSIEFFVLLSILAGSLFSLSLAALLSVLTNSILVSIAVPSILIYISSFMNSVSTSNIGWVPSSLLSPSQLLAGDKDPNEYLLHILVSITISLLFIAFSCFVPLRKIRKVGV